MRTTTGSNDQRTAAALRARLETRLGELRAKLAGELVPAPEETLAAAAGEVRDAGDEAVVIERTDVRTALMLSRDAREVGELQSAIGRLDDGQYGVCAECGLEIDAGRLRALPHGAALQRLPGSARAPLGARPRALGAAPTWPLAF